MNDITVPRRFERVATTIALLLVISSLGAVHVSAQGDPGDLGEVLWPKEEHRGFRDLAELGALFFNNTTEPLTLGLTPVQSLQAERINATATRLKAHAEGGRNVTFVQHHGYWSGERQVALTVRPAQLLPMVGVRTSTRPYARSVLTFTGPPGSVDLNGTTVDEKVENLTGSLGFPVEVTNQDLNPRGLSGLYGQPGCYERSDGRCTLSAIFDIVCPSCTLVGFGGPTGDSRQDRQLAGIGMALFDDRDRMIATWVPYVFDLNESAVLDPADARDQAADGLRNRGYDVLKVPDPEDVQVMGVLASNRVDIREIHYRWQSFIVPPESGSGINQSAEIVQNAATGEVLSVDLRPTHAVEPLRNKGLIIPPANIALALLVLGIAAVTRRLR